MSPRNWAPLMWANRPFERQERAVGLGRSGERAQGQPEVGEEAEGEDRSGLDQEHRPRPDLAAGVGEDEQDDDRHDGDGQAVVRDAQAAEQRSEQQVAIAPLLSPHERPMEEQRDDEHVQAVHLGERRFLPDRAR